MLLFLATLAVGFSLAPFLIARLGPTAYGVWAFVESLAACFTLLDLGVSTCLVRFVAAGDRTALNRLLATAFWLLVSAAGAGLAFGAILLLPLSGHLESRGVSVGFLLLVLFPVATGLPMGVFPAALDGLQRTADKCLIRLGVLLVRTAALVAVVSYEASLMRLGVVLAGFAFLEQLLLAAWCRFCEPRLSVARAYRDPAARRELIQLGSKAFAILVAGRAGAQAGPILLGLWVAGPQVAWYAIAFRLVDWGKNGVRSFTHPLTAAFGELSKRNDPRPIRTLFRHATRWTLYAAIPLQVGIWFWGEWFLRHWLDDTFASEAGPALGILALTITPALAQSVAARILFGLGDLHFFAKIAAYEATACCLLSLALLPAFGLAGLAFAFALPNIVACLLLVRHACQRIEFGLWDYVEEWLPPYLCGVALNFFWVAVLSLKPAVPGGLVLLAGVLVYGMCVTVVERKPVRAVS